jgi:hypothetical protein
MANNNNNNNNNNLIYESASLTAQVPIVRPAQGHKTQNSANTQKQNTKQTKQEQCGRKSSIKSTRAKAINPPKHTEVDIFLSQIIAEFVLNK